MVRVLALVSLVLVPMPAVAAVVFEDGTFDPAGWEVTQVGSPVCLEVFPLALDCANATISGPCACSWVTQEPVGGFGGDFRGIDLYVLGEGDITWFHHLKEATYDPRGPQGPLVSLDYSEDALGAVDDEDVGDCAPDVGATGQATGPALRQNGTLYVRPGLVARCAWTHEEVRGLVADDFVAIDGSGGPHPDFSGQGTEADARLELGFFRANARPEGDGPQAPHRSGGGIDNFRIVLDPVCVTDDDCDDRDECTSETCAGGRCIRARLPGFDGVRCELQRARAALPGVCGSEQLPAKLQQRIDTRLARTERVLADRHGGRVARRRQQRRGLRLLGRADVRVRRLEYLDRGCQLSLYGLISNLEMLLFELHVGK